MCVKTPHRRIPSLRDSVQHLLRKCICYWQALSSGQTWRLHDSGFGCQIVPCAWERRSLFSGIVHEAKSPPVLGTTADLGHFGATNRTDSFSSLILQSMQADVSLEERHTCVLSASCELVHPLPGESVWVNKTAGSECSPPMRRDPPTVKTQTWQLLLQGAWWAHTAERADFFSGSSLALGAAFLLRETASGMQLRFQCRWPAVSVRAGSLALRALMALRLRLSWSHRRLMFMPNSSWRGLWSSHMLRWKGARTRRWFHTGALWQEVANGLRLLLRFNKALRECFHRHSEKTWGIHGKGYLLQVLQLVQSQLQVTI